MVAALYTLHSQSAPLAGFLRVGATGHRKLEAMPAAGHLPYKRVVFEASHAITRSQTPTFRGRGRAVNSVLERK